jgi:hypothetical protein
MYVYPDMDIRFPEDKESTLADAMVSRARGRWEKSGSPVNRPTGDGEYFFHRESDGGIPACTLCMSRQTPGHLVVRNIVPDAMGDQITIEQYVTVLREFDDQIAGPAAEGLDGMTSIDTDTRTLEDYFSKDSIARLEHFCKDSNQGDLGTHLADQRKWMAFLIEVHRNEKEKVHCDVFGRLLKAKGWWPEYGIATLVSEYDFGLRLLEQADKTEK